MAHASDSSEQLAAESLILQGVAQRFGLADLAPARLSVGDAVVDLDGWSPSAQVAVEIYARVTPPKGGAIKKPMDDAMRLLLVRSHYRGARVVLAFADSVVADHFRVGKGWRPAALRSQSIEVVDVALDADTIEALREATKRQYR